MIATLPDWRKQAAQAGMDQDDGAVEQAFMEQAYTFLANRAAPILRPPYRLGFEIVYKTDDNSRLVGVFIFRVSKSLFFAPIFWLNGQIKGTDLFYCVEEQQFVPLTTEWLDYVIAKAVESPGKSVSRDVTAKSPRQLNLWQLAYPPVYQGFPGFLKGAAKQECQEIFAEMCVAADKKMGAGIFKDFLKAAGTDAVDSLVYALRKNQDFACTMTELLGGPGNYIPVQPQVKAASTAPAITLHVHPAAETLEKCASTDEERKRAHWLGYLVEDTRTGISRTFEPEEEIFEAITDPGQYRVLLSDGSAESLWVFAVNSNAGGYPSSCCSSPSRDVSTSCSGQDTYARPYDPQVPVMHDTVLYSPESKRTREVHEKEIWGEALSESKDVEGVKPAAGKCYLIIDDKSRVALTPFKILKIEETDGGPRKVFYDTLPNPYEESSRYFLLQDGRLDEQFLSTDPGREEPRVLDDRYKFLEVYYPDTKERVAREDYLLPMPGDRSAVFNKIMHGGFGKATVHRTKMAYQAKLETQAGREVLPELGRAQMEVRLMAQLGINKQAAAWAMDKLESKPKVSFYYAQDSEKSASVQPSYWPEFLQHFDDALGVPAEDAQSYAVPSISPDYSALNPMISHLGDRKKLIETGGQAMLSTPSELSDFARSTDQKQVFEHGVVGQLLKTFDSSGIVEQFMPQLEAGLDRIGRMLFLLYWKPADFAQIYGVDNTQEMENKFISCFKLLGEIVLDLKKKLPQGNGNLQINI